MAQQIIDTGAAANDGTGEPLRDAFTAVNENFTEIYTAGPVGSNVVISGNTITVTGVNNNLVLRANGIGNIQANSTIMPSIDAVTVTLLWAKDILDAAAAMTPVMPDPLPTKYCA